MQCSAFTGDKQFTNEQISNIKFPLMSKFPVLSYPSSLPNLATIHTEKFLVLPQSLRMIQTRILISLKSLFHLLTRSDYSSALHCSAKLSVTVYNFTIHHNSHPYVQLAQWLSF